MIWDETVVNKSSMHYFGHVLRKIILCIYDFLVFFGNFLVDVFAPVSFAPGRWSSH